MYGSSNVSARKRRTASSPSPSAARTASSRLLPSASIERARDAALASSNPRSCMPAMTLSTAQTPVSPPGVLAEEGRGEGEFERRAVIDVRKTPSPQPSPTHTWEREKSLIQHAHRDQHGFLPLREHFLQVLLRRGQLSLGLL